MVQLYNITIYQGANVSIQIIAKDTEGNPLDLTNYVTSGYIRERYTSTGILLDLKPQIDGSFVSGLINIDVSGFLTTNLPVIQGVYDIDLFNEDIGYATKAVRGYCNIEPQVTF